MVPYIHGGSRGGKVCKERSVAVVSAACGHAGVGSRKPFFDCFGNHRFTLKLAVAPILFLGDFGPEQYPRFLAYNRVKRPLQAPCCATSLATGSPSRHTVILCRSPIRRTRQGTGHAPFTTINIAHEQQAQSLNGFGISRDVCACRNPEVPRAGHFTLPLFFVIAGDIKSERTKMMSFIDFGFRAFLIGSRYSYRNDFVSPGWDFSLSSSMRRVRDSPRKAS